MNTNLSPSEKRLPEVAVDLDALESGTSLWQDAWHRLRKNHLALASFWVLVFMVAFCFIGPFLSPHDYRSNDLDKTLVGPGLAHLFGTDDLGRDQLTRVMVGGRVSLGVGIIATTVSLLIGVTYGATAAYIGGKVDAGMMRIVDVLYALPFTIFVILLMTIFERSIVLLFVVIGAVEWLTMARIVRGQVLSLKKQEFVEAAVSLGYSTRRIILRHIIPNVLGVVVVYATLTVPAVMLLESFLSFLGLGVQPPMPSWGSLIKLGADNIQLYPYLLIIPAFFFSLTLFSLNFLGDGLRDALDPKSSKD
ncbi:ABC transporter permease subunit [Puniceicoccales bacterium CK1056]|uniref:Oligopeptide transport system permease protein OppC n=1 Tax=Oceanipulchritudo coccoides TaxID=2706888 RepID=A0A6B2LWS2_9BACT|nr:ABC transporter permease subunit [Oceanipulchritudo coccoides]NDV60948.1 ABC transporter permease subunit [Oceanipulchritudo coccoides]